MENTADQPQEPLVKGAFSAGKRITVGTGTTKQRVTLDQKDYFYAEEPTAGTVEVRPLNENFAPTGDKTSIAKKDFLEKYSPEPQLYMNEVAPAMREMERTINQADENRQEGRMFTAEMEYKSVLKIDENHIRATFGLGLTYLEIGDTQNADEVFRKLSKLNGAFDHEHKHLFNEFGIKLRMNKMYTQALKHYARAWQLSKDDEHIMYNLARVYFEKGDMRRAFTFLSLALKANPDFMKARELLEHIRETAGQPQPAGMSFGEESAA